jgi:mannose-6-phosphate isomerase
MIPRRLLPLLKERPWGVRSLAPWLPDAVTAGPIGEAWFTSDENQFADGQTLRAAIAADPAGMLGASARGPSCPLLLKFLFTSERLSVQVHPDDEYARTHHGSLGKTEAWHVLEAQRGATLGLGFTRPLARDEAVSAARTGGIEHLLSWQPASAGDTRLVPAGTVHAIGAGFTIVEVQENSDVTYRLFDYGRPRELHLDHGFAVATLGTYSVENDPTALAPGRTRLTTCPYFTLERWEVAGSLHVRPAPYFHLVIVTVGEGRIAGRRTGRGDVWFAPASTERTTMDFNDGEVLVTYPSQEPTESISCG